MLKQAHGLGAVAVGLVAWLTVSQWGCQTTCSTASDCGVGSYCFTADDACLTAQVVGFCKPLPASCAAAVEPVCGCDGNQYQNACEAARSGVSVTGAGTCPTPACGGADALPCAGTTTYCQFPVGTCTQGAPAGSCAAVPSSCSALSAPVCGCDGVTYANTCEAAKAQASVEAAGACACGGPGGVTCAASEFCSYGTSDSISGLCLTPDSLGSCEPRPTTCAAVPDTVCGCDGNTYPNPCEAAKAGWAVALPGACPTGTGDAGTGDAGPEDAGDAGPEDAGDAGTEDAGTGDAGTGGAAPDDGGSPILDSTPPVITGTVTLRGNVFTSVATGVPGQEVYFTALDGPTAIEQQYASIIAADYPSQGSMNAAAARTLQSQFSGLLTYNVGGTSMSALFDVAQYTARSIYDLTGEIVVENGVTWFNVSSYTSGDTFTYPAHMMDPDVPFAPPPKPPLVLNVGSLTLTFIYVAPGSFLMGEPYYTFPTWEEDPPHLVTLTKGYYLAEIPITWELYLAATGVDISTGTVNTQAAANVSCANAYAFAAALAAQNPGYVVRPPTSAELVYAMRVGTSNPPFAQKCNGAGIVSSMTGAVKATAPNPWGFYEWMNDEGWERSADLPISEHQDVTDPSYLPPQDPSNPTQAHQHAGFGCAGYPIGEFEYITNTAGPVTVYPNSIRERMVVEE